VSGAWWEVTDHGDRRQTAAATLESGQRSTASAVGALREGLDPLLQGAGTPDSSASGATPVGSPDRSLEVEASIEAGFSQLQVVPAPPPTRHARASAALVPRHATSPRIVCGARRKVFLTSGWRCVRSRGRPSARRPRCRSCLPRRPNATCIATSLSTSSPGALHLQSLSHILYLTLHLK